MVINDSYKLLLNSIDTIRLYVFSTATERANCFYVAYYKEQSYIIK